MTEDLLASNTLSHLHSVLELPNGNVSNGFLGLCLKYDALRLLNRDILDQHPPARENLAAALRNNHSSSIVSSSSRPWVFIAPSFRLLELCDFKTCCFLLDEETDPHWCGVTGNVICDTHLAPIKVLWSTLQETFPFSDLCSVILDFLWFDICRTTFFHE